MSFFVRRDATEVGKGFCVQGVLWWPEWQKKTHPDVQDLPAVVQWTDA
jgi:hypothetical protein